MFRFLLIKDYNCNYTCTVIVLIYTSKCTCRFINPNSQVNCIFLLLIIRGFRLSEEIHFLSTQCNGESTIIYLF
jgi:hypothetical protein